MIEYHESELNSDDNLWNQGTSITTKWKLKIEFNKLQSTWINYLPRKSIYKPIIHKNNFVNPHLMVQVFYYYELHLMLQFLSQSLFCVYYLHK